MAMRHPIVLAGLLAVMLVLPASALGGRHMVQVGGKLVVPADVSAVQGTADTSHATPLPASDGESWTSAGIVSAATAAVALALLFGVTRIKRAPIPLRAT